jgi:asparagine synthase (glutamine-hydrolysing)
MLRQVSIGMLHGGPDAQTVATGPQWALGNNRLAIQGIRGGRQPFELERMHCVFNGEIYNHRILRAELEAFGEYFDDDCDGNVILPLYRRYGDAFVRRLEGMYAIAIVDVREAPCLKLFNDHAGMKSLYWFMTADGKGLRFASELRALARFPDFPHEVDPLAVDRYFGGKAVWGPTTIYSKVNTLEPGSMLRLDLRGALRQSWQPLAGAEDAAHRDASVEEVAATLDRLLQEELSRLLDADVPVCVVTSGGLDSSYLTALAKQRVPDLASFNIAYDGDWPSDERHFAAEVARHCGTRHHQVLLPPSGFPQLVERFVTSLDQPNNAPHSLSTYALFEAIHEAGFKVALTGDGADELFGGYKRFVDASADSAPGWQRRYQRTMAVAGSSLLSELYTSQYQEAVLAAGGFFTDRVGDELAARCATAARDKLETLLRYDQFARFPYYILRRVDHLSMAHAVEARIPFLQPSIVRLAASLPARLKVDAGKVKAPVAVAASRWIPASIIDRPKQPFTLPIAAMIRPGEALHDMIGDVLLSSTLRCRDYLDTTAIRSLFDLQSTRPDATAAEVLWSILVLELWLSGQTTISHKESIHG